MKRCPECGFRTEDKYCPLCGVRTREMEVLTHVHGEGEECMLTPPQLQQQRSVCRDNLRIQQPAHVKDIRKIQKVVLNVVKGIGIFFLIEIIATILLSFL